MVKSHQDAFDSAGKHLTRLRDIRVRKGDARGPESEKVTGIGGLFLCAQDPAVLASIVASRLRRRIATTRRGTSTILGAHQAVKTSTEAIAERTRKG